MKKKNKVKEPITLYETWQGHIIIDPHIKGGKPVIKGTRLPVEIVLGSLAAGMNFKEICKAYMITLEDIKACLAFSAQILNEEKFFTLPR